YTGPDSFTYQATDGFIAGNSVTVTITVVDPAATAPIAEDDVYSATQNILLTVSAPGVLGNDDHIVGDTLSIVVDSGPAHGTLTPNVAVGSFTYLPNLNYTGPDTFTYHVHDATVGSDSNTAMVIITVRAAGSSPTVMNDNYTTDENT